MHCHFVDTAGGSSGSPRQIKYRSLECPPIVDEGVTTSGSETRNTAYEEEEIHITVLSRNGGGGVWLHGRQTENTPSTRQVAMADAMRLVCSEHRAQLIANQSRVLIASSNLVYLGKVQLIADLHFRT